MKSSLCVGEACLREDGRHHSLAILTTGCAGWQEPELLAKRFDRMEGETCTHPHDFAFKAADLVLTDRIVRRPRFLHFVFELLGIVLPADGSIVALITFFNMVLCAVFRLL